MNAYGVSVTNLRTSGGNIAPNQYVISDGRFYVYQSYLSTIAVYDLRENVLTLGDKWDYSKTTMKYLHTFMVEYVQGIWDELPKKRSFRETIESAIDSYIIDFDVNMW